MGWKDWIVFAVIAFGSWIAIKLTDGSITDGSATRCTIVAAMCVVVGAIRQREK